MRSGCGITRDWLLTSGVAAAPLEVAQHLVGCDGCRRLVDGYHGAVERFAATSALESALRVPSFARVRMAVPLVDAPPIWRRWLAPVGAALALAAGLVLWAMLSRGAPLAPSAPEPQASIEPPSNGSAIDAQIAVVSRPPDAEVAVLDWSRESAEVEVTHGSARFQVAPHLIGERFVVRTPLATVTAIGTEFGVAHDGGVTTIDITEGVVLVEAPSLGIEVTLAAGQSLTLTPAPAIVQERAPDVPEVVADVVKVDVEATLREARRLLAKDKATQAVALLERELARGGARDRLSAVLGDARRLAGDLAGAARAYEAASQSRAPTLRARALEDLAATRAGLGDTVRTNDAWARYLEAAPLGRAAPKALFALGREGELMRAFPDAAETTTVVVNRGRALLKARDWEGAVALFTPWLQSGDAARAEAALVGIMRARLGQGRRDDVGKLGEWYRERFPQGARLREVEQMMTAAGL